MPDGAPLSRRFLEAGVLGQVRDVAVHFAVYFYILDHLFAIRLQSAIKVVQVLMPDTLRAVALNNLVGRVFDNGS